MRTQQPIKIKDAVKNSLKKMTARTPKGDACSHFFWYNRVDEYASSKNLSLDISTFGSEQVDMLSSYLFNYKNQILLSISIILMYKVIHIIQLYLHNHQFYLTNTYQAL